MLRVVVSNRAGPSMDAIRQENRGKIDEREWLGSVNAVACMSLHMWLSLSRPVLGDTAH